MGLNRGDFIAKPGMARASAICPRFRFALASRSALTLLGIFLALTSNAARADPIFASFQAGDFNFVNNTGTPTSSGLFSTGQTTFEFNETVTADSITYPAGTPITNVTVTLTSKVDGVVTQGTIGSTTYDDQKLQNGTLEFQDQHGNNLLTISNFIGDIVGADGGSTADLDIDHTAPPEQGTYSSDFLTFSPPSDVVTSPGLTLDVGDLSVGANHYLANFNASADGSFSGIAAPVPEPSSIGIIGLSSLLLLRRRRA